jgi:uncharacterized phage protein gp47/JayE
MPWSTPTLKDTRKLTRDYVLSQLGAKAMVPNSVLRIMSDAKAALAHLTLLYLDWLAKQLMPDTAEKEWLDRHGQIWLTNADGSKGRKAASYASGRVEFTGSTDTVIPIGTIMTGENVIAYQTVTEGDIGTSGFGEADVVALTAGAAGNLPDGASLTVTYAGVDSATCLGEMTGGAEEETDDQLRERILFRIQNPPMGGSEADYVRWALEVSGVTRAWAATEQGVGTITVRFLTDNSTAGNHGLPSTQDIIAVSANIDKNRPVTVADCYVLAPLPFFYSITIKDLVRNDPTVRANIQKSLLDMEMKRSQPGQPMYRSWVDEAVSSAVGEDTHELIFETQYMPAPGYMAMLDTIYYG